MSATATCAMCGTVYDPADATGCASCPVGSHCAIACCPACGYSTVDLRRSRLASLAARVAGIRWRRTSRAGEATTVASARQGQRVRIEGIAGLPSWQERQLVGYGVAPGREAEIVQTSPVIVVRVDHVELAFERRVGRGIRIADPVSSGGTAASAPVTASEAA